jgi:hypothetical protein
MRRGIICQDRNRGTGGLEEERDLLCFVRDLLEERYWIVVTLLIALSALMFSATMLGEILPSSGLSVELIVVSCTIKVRSM